MSFEMKSAILLWLINAATLVVNLWMATRNVDNARANLRRCERLIDWEHELCEWRDARRIVETHDATGQTRAGENGGNG